MTGYYKGTRRQRSTSKSNGNKPDSLEVSTSLEIKVTETSRRGPQDKDKDKSTDSSAENGRTSPSILQRIISAFSPSALTSSFSTSLKGERSSTRNSVSSLNQDDASQMGETKILESTVRLDTPTRSSSRRSSRQTLITPLVISSRRNSISGLQQQTNPSVKNPGKPAPQKALKSKQQEMKQKRAASIASSSKNSAKPANNSRQKNTIPSKVKTEKESSKSAKDAAAVSNVPPTSTAHKRKNSEKSPTSSSSLYLRGKRQKVSDIVIYVGSETGQSSGRQRIVVEKTSPSTSNRQKKNRGKSKEPIVADSFIRPESTLKTAIEAALQTVNQKKAQPSERTADAGPEKLTERQRRLKERSEAPDYIRTPSLESLTELHQQEELVHQVTASSNTELLPHTILEKYGRNSLAVADNLRWTPSTNDIHPKEHGRGLVACNGCSRVYMKMFLLASELKHHQSIIEHCLEDMSCYENLAQKYEETSLMIRKLEARNASLRLQLLEKSASSKNAIPLRNRFRRNSDSQIFIEREVAHQAALAGLHNHTKTVAQSSSSRVNRRKPLPEKIETKKQSLVPYPDSPIIQSPKKLYVPAHDDLFTSPTTRQVTAAKNQSTSFTVNQVQSPQRETRSPKITSISNSLLKRTVEK